MNRYKELLLILVGLGIAIVVIANIDSDTKKEMNFYKAQNVELQNKNAELNGINTGLMKAMIAQEMDCNHWSKK